MTPFHLFFHLLRKSCGVFTLKLCLCPEEIKKNLYEAFQHRLNLCRHCIDPQEKFSDLVKQPQPFNYFSYEEIISGSNRYKDKFEITRIDSSFNQAP